MSNHLVFATSFQDAKDATDVLGLEFSETVWVLNAQLLGAGDFSGHTVHYTDLFKQMPAYVEAHEIFGDPTEG